MNKKEKLAVIIISLLIINMILFGLQLYSTWIFWAVIAISAIIAYKIFPKLK